MTTWRIVQTSIDPEYYRVTKIVDGNDPIELATYHGELHAVMVEMADHFEPGDLVVSREGIFPVLTPNKALKKN